MLRGIRWNRGILGSSLTIPKTSVVRRIESKSRNCFTNQSFDTISKASVNVAFNSRGHVQRRTFSSEREVEEARATIRDAIRTLSEGVHQQPVTSPPVADVLKWESIPLSDLSVNQLEELGRAYYEGLYDDDNEGNDSDNSSTKLDTKRGIDLNREKAVEVWTEASKRGSIESMYSLAVCLRKGVGCQKDPSRAFSLMETLVEKHNYYLAHFALGVMLQNAEGTPRDDARAFQHFKAAGKAGLLPSLQHIAHCYADGKGVKQSDKNAALYYEAAVEAGDVFAKYTLATWIYKGRGGLKVDKDRAFRLQLEAASAGHPAAMFNVGAHYMSGEGVTRDLSEAMVWFDKASLAGMVPATLNLAKMHFEGVANGGVRDVKKAKEILKRHVDKSDECKAALQELEGFTLV